MKNILIVGCGLSGAVLGEQFATNGFNVTIIEKRDHIGGNCYDFYNKDGILMNKYGAHLFHTNNDHVWMYVKKFSEWIEWEHRVVGYVNGNYVPIPVNITTVNKLFDTNIKNDIEMRQWLDSNQTKYIFPANGKEAALNRVGPELYKLIFETYTKKQWDKYPEELDASVLQRIPVRDNFDDRYFIDKYQALPKYGYTNFFAKLLKHENISVHLNTDFFEYSKVVNLAEYSKIIYTGPIDQYFGDSGYPKLEYRSINFKEESHDVHLFQSNSVVNYPGPDTEYTRIVEYKHFLNQKTCTGKTIIVKEYTTDDGEPYYPVPNDKNRKIFEMYKLLADKESKDNNVIFVGRLANYKYFNMDEAIANALNIFQSIRHEI